MSVSCGLTECPEALLAAMDSEKKLQEVAAQFDCENSELATLYLEARNKLEELKIQLKKQRKKDEGQHINELQLLTGEGAFKIITIWFLVFKIYFRRERNPVLHSLHPEGF